MADHAEVEYATAAGNDYDEHEGTYRRFLHLTVVLVVHAINTLLGLAIGGVMGHWLTAFAVFVIATGAAVHGLLSGSKTSSVVAFILSLVAFAFSAAG
ncbi:MAG: aa3-type cytochrome c oxidase subunit IV [Xanthobacteraceae bacterium]|jgi:Bacterial aa3 type cytochrome c oxidase subunit IV|nr:aa3-type cytochrome c oxidase subunit IV [Xanthobacteraceae bacterium]